MLNRSTSTNQDNFPVPIQMQLFVLPQPVRSTAKITERREALERVERCFTDLCRTMSAKRPSKEEYALARRNYTSAFSECLRAGLTSADIAAAQVDLLIECQALRSELL